MSKIKSLEKSNCPICSFPGVFLYEKLIDKYFSASGQWDFFKCSNKTCNLIWLNPMPIKEDISLAYNNYYTHTYELGNYNDSKLRKIYKRIQAEFIGSKYGYNNAKFSFLKYVLYLDPDRLEQTKFDIMYLEKLSGKLLDVGCGNGIFLEIMNKLGWETIGVDFDEKAIESAKLKKLNVRLGDLTEQKFPDNYFDAITISHVIEHVYNPIELVEECYRLLKTDGKMVIATPNNESLGHHLFKQYWRGLEPPRHIQIFSPQSLIHIVRLSGFRKYSSFTTNRIARYIFNFSGEMRQNKLRKNEVSNITRVKARIFSFVEWMLIKMKIGCGEEVVIIAEKIEKL